MCMIFVLQVEFIWSLSRQSCVLKKPELLLRSCKSTTNITSIVFCSADFPSPSCNNSIQSNGSQSRRCAGPIRIDPEERYNWCAIVNGRLLETKHMKHNFTRVVCSTLYAIISYSEEKLDDFVNTQCTLFHIRTLVHYLSCLKLSVIDNIY